MVENGNGSGPKAAVYPYYQIAAKLQQKLHVLTA